MKTFLELLENVKSADKKPEIYTKSDGKKGTRMVPMDKEVIKKEKTLEWLKASLAREAAKVKPRQDDMEEAYENTMYCKKCGCERGNPDPDCSCDMNNATLTDAQCYSEQSKCGSLRKEDVNELTIADVQKATAMAKKRQEKEREAGKKSVSTADLGARMPKKEDQAHDPKHVKQAVGIASDPRYKGGNMTGATKVINKLSKGLSDHPQVKAVLRRQNEGVKSFAEISQRTKASYVKKATSQNKSAQKAYDKEVRDPKNYFAADDTPSMKKNKTTMLKRGDGIARAKGKDAKTRNVYPESVATNEISKGMASRYIKKAQVSTADAAKSTERGYTDSRSGDRDISKAGKDQAKKGIKTFINRNKGTSTAVDKLTGKAKVPAREGIGNMAQDIAKDKIDQEKNMDAKRHDRMMDKARTKDTKTKNMSEQ